MTTKGIHFLKSTAKTHGKHGDRPIKFDTAEFVGWDGEGAVIDGRPEYILLQNSAGGTLKNPKGLSSLECYRFLISEAERHGPNTIHIGYGFTYDSSMMARDVPRLDAQYQNDLRHLGHGEKVWLNRNIAVEYRQRKSLWVKDYAKGVSILIYDVFGFFQSSFITALEKWLPPNKSDNRIALIKEGKSRRSDFTPEEMPFIERYNRAELSALVDLANSLRDSLRSAHLKVKRWDGAGAVAAALLTRQKFKEHLAPTPPEVLEAARYAYFGGRIETLRYGYYEGTVHHADINSAYPAAFRSMPSLRFGTWRRTKEPERPFSLLKIEWDFSRVGGECPLLPFGFRASDGSIYFPPRGKSWAWLPEVAAAREFPELAKRFRVTDGWEFVPTDDTYRPFSWVDEVYAERFAMIEKKDPGEKALKLGLNSCYGKTAQNLGGSFERPPPFHQLEYAGYMTAVTRAKLFQVGNQIPKGLISFATDGILSTEPIPVSPSAKSVLGGWEVTTHEAILIAQSGVYWLRDPAPKNNQCPRCKAALVPGPLSSVGHPRTDSCKGYSTLTEHSRGFDLGSLSPDGILAAWRDLKSEYPGSSTRFVGVGRGSISEDSYPLFRRFVTEPRTLIIHGTGKREDVIVPHRWGRTTRNPGYGLLPTHPADPYEYESAPYLRAWERPAKREQIAAEKKERKRKEREEDEQDRIRHLSRTGRVHPSLTRTLVMEYDAMRDFGDMVSLE